MPYIRDPDFREICVLIELIGETSEDNSTIRKMIDKTNNILEGYKRE